MSSIPAFGPANVSAVPLLALATLAGEPTTASSDGIGGAPAKNPRQPSLSTETTAMLLAEQNKQPTPASFKTGGDPGGRDFRKATFNFLDLRGSNFRGASLVAVDLSGVSGSDIDLSGADPCDAPLGRALLAAATGRGADAVIAAIRDAGLGRVDFANADLTDAPVEYFYMRAFADGVHERARDGSPHLTKRDPASVAMMNLGLNGDACANSVPDGMGFVGTGFDRTGFAPIGLVSADVGMVRPAQLPDFALNSMLGLDLRGFDFTGQFRWFPAERRRRAARWRRRREPSSQQFRRFGFEDAFYWQ